MSIDGSRNSMNANAPTVTNKEFEMTFAKVKKSEANQNCFRLKNDAPFKIVS